MGVRSVQSGAHSFVLWTSAGGAVVSEPGITFTSYAPTSSVTGGNSVATLTGTNFVGPVSVTFGPYSSNTKAVVNTSTITCTVPAANASGATTITITQATKTASLSNFTYFGVPTLTGLTPSSGTTGAGTVLTLTGTQFVPSSTTVTVGTGNATGVTVTAFSSLTCAAPSSTTTGAVAVIVTTPSGSVTSAGAYTYATSDEPIDPGSGYLYYDPMTKYGDAVADISLLLTSNNHFGSYYGGGGPNGANSRIAIFSTDNKSVIVGPDGNYAMRSTVQGGIAQATYTFTGPYIDQFFPLAAGGTAMQTKVRISSACNGIGSGCKFWEMWGLQTAWAGSNRVQFSYPTNNGRMEVVAGSNGQGHNTIDRTDGFQGPTFVQLADDQYHTWTMYIKFNTNSNYDSTSGTNSANDVYSGAPSSRDGILRIWIAGQLTLDYSAAGLAAGHCAASDVDWIPGLAGSNLWTLTGGQYFYFPNVFNDMSGKNTFTIDFSGIKVWAA